MATKVELITSRFVNTLEPAQRVTLPNIIERDEQGQPMKDRRGDVRRRVIQFRPHRVGVDEHGNPKMHGFYTPRDAEELEELRRVCAIGYCRATELDARLSDAYNAIEELRLRQAAI